MYFSLMKKPLECLAMTIMNKQKCKKTTMTCGTKWKCAIQNQYGRSANVCAPK